MESGAEMAVYSAAVPQASYHIEVSSGDGSAAAPQAEPPPPEPLVSPAGTSGGSRSVVLVKSDPDSDPAAAGSRSVKYVLTGLQSAHNGAGVGVAPIKSPAVVATGQSTSAARARQILKRRLDLSLAEKKYTKTLHPELAAAEGDASGEAQTEHTPVMICEPEAESAQKKGRTFFFVAKPPGEAAEEEVQEAETVAEMPQLPDDPAPSERPATAAATDLGVLKRLARYRLSEKYEILPAASFEEAEEIMHRLRVQNLMLKTELVRQATEHEKHRDEHGLLQRRGRKKATTMVTVDRLRELEKIEAGMHTLFTPSQVKALSRDYKKNSVQWRDEDFRRALGLLEHSSQHTFNYVRKVMNVPLPSIGTLKLRCPLQPELHVRLEAALQERGGEQQRRCKQHGHRTSSAQRGAGDGAEEGDYQQPEPMSAEDQPQEVAHWETPPPGILKRRRSRGGGTAARKVARQEEEVVFYEAPPAPPARGKVRRTVSAGGGGGRQGRPVLDAYEPPPSQHRRHHQEQQQQQQEPEIIDDDEYDDEDDEPEDSEDFDEEFGEEDVEVDPQQQEVPAPQYGQFRTSYESGWNEWDPRQLQ